MRHRRSSRGVTAPFIMWSAHLASRDHSLLYRLLIESNWVPYGRSHAVGIPRGRKVDGPRRIHSDVSRILWATDRGECDESAMRDSESMSEPFAVSGNLYRLSTLLRT